MTAVAAGGRCGSCRLAPALRHELQSMLWIVGRTDGSFSELGAGPILGSFYEGSHYLGPSS